MSFRYLKNDLLEEVRALEEKARAEPQPEIVARCLYEIWRRYRAAAISVLLADSDREAFFARLKLSGEARLRLLRDKSNATVQGGRFACAGLLEPFFDSMAAGADMLARDIATNSPADWNTKHELEDDFHYARFLFEFLKDDGAAGVEGAGHLDKFKAALEGGESPRLQLCRALYDHDPAAFEEAFDDLVEEWQHFHQAKYKRSAWKDWVLLSERKVCVEGLALLCLAERAGFETRLDYPGIPGIARTGLKDPGLLGEGALPKSRT